MQGSSAAGAAGAAAAAAGGAAAGAATVGFGAAWPVLTTGRPPARLVFGLGCGCFPDLPAGFAAASATGSAAGGAATSQVTVRSPPGVCFDRPYSAQS